MGISTILHLEILINMSVVSDLHLVKNLLTYSNNVCETITLKK